MPPVGRLWPSDDDDDDDHNEAVGTLSEQLTIGGTGAETPLAEFERTTCACALSTVGVMMMCSKMLVMSTMMIVMSTMMLGPSFNTILQLFNWFVHFVHIIIGVGNSDGNDADFGINFL